MTPADRNLFVRVLAREAGVDLTPEEAERAIDPPERPEVAMRRCRCGRLFALVTGRERTCDPCDPEERENVKSRRMLGLPDR